MSLLHAANSSVCMCCPHNITGYITPACFFATHHGFLVCLDQLALGGLAAFGVQGLRCVRPAHRPHPSASRSSSQSIGRCGSCCVAAAATLSCRCWHNACQGVCHGWLQPNLLVASLSAPCRVPWLQYRASSERYLTRPITWVVLETGACRGLWSARHPAAVVLCAAAEQCARAVLVS